MHDSRLTWFQFQSDVFQPGFQHCLGLLHALFRRVKNAEVVRIADKIGLSFSVREGLRHLGFHAMQRNVSQQWGGHSTLRRSAYRLLKDSVVYRTSFEPCLDDTPYGWIGVELS